MAIEAVFTVGLSLIVAVAAIAVFNDYRGSVMDTIEDRHASVIKSQVVTSIYNLQDASSGSYISVELPENDQTDYRLSLGGGKFLISAGSDEYEMELNGMQWVDQFRGSVQGSSVKITKVGDDIVLRSG